VAAELGLHEHTVGKWRRRFLKDRCDGLLDEARPGRPRTIDDDQVAAVNPQDKDVARAPAALSRPLHAVERGGINKPHVVQQENFLALALGLELRLGECGRRLRDASGMSVRNRR
jgi:hypothetical protein